MNKAEKAASSASIKKFINEIWETLELPEDWKPRRGTPSEQRDQAIRILREEVDEVADFHYKRGAIDSVRTLNRLRRKAGAKRATAGVDRKSWDRRVSGMFPKAGKDYKAGKRAW